MKIIRTIGKYFGYTLLATGTVGAVGTALSLHTNTLDSTGIVRIGRATVTAITIVHYYKSSIYAKDWDVESVEYEEMKSKVHKKSALKLLELCRRNKGVYIKVGQHIGTMDYLLPGEYVDTLKILHSQAPASTMEDIRQVVKEDLQINLEDVFVSFDPKPIGAASLAQVHKAYLEDGTVVALKVQHPTVKANSLVDLKTMEVLSVLVSWALPDFKIRWLVDETKRNIPLELDFSIEVKNTERAKAMFRHLHWLKIPKVYRNLCSSRVIAFEFVEGGQINDLEYIHKNNINPSEISDKLGQLYSEMIFVRGFVHSDPHPGNILVRKNKKGQAELVLLDHGLYAELADDFRCRYANLWLSIMNRDVEQIKKSSAIFGEEKLYWLFAGMIAGRTWETIEAGITTTQFGDKEKEQFQREVPLLLPNIFDIMTKTDRQLILIMKTNDLLRGIERTLQTFSRMESFKPMFRCCIETVYDERRRQCINYVQRLRITLAKRWKLFTLSLYYRYLHFCSYYYR